MNHTLSRVKPGVKYFYKYFYIAINLFIWMYVSVYRMLIVATSVFQTMLSMLLLNISFFFAYGACFASLGSLKEQPRWLELARRPFTRALHKMPSDRVDTCSFPRNWTGTKSGAYSWIVSSGRFHTWTGRQIILCRTQELSKISLRILRRRKFR